MENEVYICNVTLHPEVHSNKDPPCISTYAIYHGPRQQELLFPSDSQLKEFCSGKEVVYHHPVGEYYGEVRPVCTAIGEVRSDKTFYSFYPLTNRQVERFLKLEVD